MMSTTKSMRRRCNESHIVRYRERRRPYSSQGANREADGIERSGRSGADDRAGALDRSLRKWPVATQDTVAAGFAYLSDGPAWPVACRSRTSPGNTQSGERGVDG